MSEIMIGERLPRFVRQYADLRSVPADAARVFAADVEAGTFPGEEHTFCMRRPGPSARYICQ